MTAHAGKFARIKDLRSWLPSRRTAAFRWSTRRCSRRDFEPGSGTWQGQFQGQ